PAGRAPCRLRRAVARPRSRGAGDRAGALLPHAPLAMNDTTPHTDRKRGRLVLLLIAGIFFGGMLTAGILRFSGCQPKGSNVHGEMLEPLVDLRERAPVLLDGGTYDW